MSGGCHYLVYPFNCHFSICFECVFLLFLCAYLCVFFLYIHYFYAMPMLILIICSTFLFTYVGLFSVLLPLLLLARSIAEFIFEQFQFLFCCSSCLALYLHIFFWLSSAHSVLCWNTTSFFTSSLVSVYLWIQTQVYYRCCLKVTPSVHLSNGISGI